MSDTGSITNPISGKRIKVSGETAKKLYKLYAKKQLTFESKEDLKKLLLIFEKPVVVGVDKKKDKEKNTSIQVDTTIYEPKIDYLVVNSGYTDRINKGYRDILRLVSNESLELIHTYNKEDKFKHFCRKQKVFGKQLHDAMMKCYDKMPPDEQRYRVDDYVLISVNHDEHELSSFSALEYVFEAWGGSSDEPFCGFFGFASAHNYTIMNISGNKNVLVIIVDCESG